MPAMKATSVWSSPCPRGGLKGKSKRTRVVITSEGDVKKPDGTVENWAVEAGPPGTLRSGRNGVRGQGVGTRRLPLLPGRHAGETLDNTGCTIIVSKIESSIAKRDSNRSQRKDLRCVRKSSHSWSHR